MSPPEHFLPYSARRLVGEIAGPVLDSIVVYPRSHGVLHLPGQYGTGQPPPQHRVKVIGAGNDGYYVEEQKLGSVECYLVAHKVWNYRDSPVFAEIIEHDEQT